MTRDEAKAAFNGISQPASFGTDSWIDRFVALGMLKLDEPKSSAEKLRETFLSYGWDVPSLAAFEQALREANIS